MKNEDKIKDIENGHLGIEVFSESSLYAEDVTPKVAQERTIKVVLEKRVAKLELKNKRYKDNTDIRRSLVIAFTTIIAFWLLAVLLILVGNNCNHYNLSENTLIALMVTSTANVIGMMIVILKNLFPEKPVKSIITK